MGGVGALSVPYVARDELINPLIFIGLEKPGVIKVSTDPGPRIVI